MKETNSESVEAYERFATIYSEAIYRAWFVDIFPPKNEVLGYRLIELCKEGAFGTVYRATDNAGKNFAIKVLHEKVRRNREMLQSFRRGVSSMRILKQSLVDGVVSYHDASEIPALVVMDFIEGIDLVDATRKGVLSDWADLIRICRELTSIIRSSHRLPQRVLHRDIRPSNIMLENCWGPSPDWEETKLWVLDFDLSHHLDAFDVSVATPGQANGYLAPEQVERHSGITTRNATVDSFGLGMTFYFLRTGVEPRFAQHRYGDWISTLEGVATNYPCIQWQSLPFRFARLISNATKELQEARLEVAIIEDELMRLENAISSPGSVTSAEMLAEELAALGFDGIYEWDNDRVTAHRTLGNIQLRIVGDEIRKLVRFEYEWLQLGQIHHQDVKKWLPKAKEKVDSVLRRLGWKPKTSISTGQLSGTATIDLHSLRKNLPLHGRLIGEARDAFTFD